MSKQADALPVLMFLDDVIPIERAMILSGCCDRTIRDWCRKHGIGRKPANAGRWQVSGPALEAVLHGDLEAVELLRKGERDSQRVTRWIDQFHNHDRDLG